MENLIIINTFKIDQDDNKTHQNLQNQLPVSVTNHLGVQPKQPAANRPSDPCVLRTPPSKAKQSLSKSKKSLSQARSGEDESQSSLPSSSENLSSFVHSKLVLSHKIVASNKESETVQKCNPCSFSIRVATVSDINVEQLLDTTLGSEAEATLSTVSQSVSRGSQGVSFNLDSVSLIEIPKAKPVLKTVTFDNLIIIYYFKDNGNEERKGYWVENRCHFQRHCNKIQDIISFIFQDLHRHNIQKLIQKWEQNDNDFKTSIL